MTQRIALACGKQEIAVYEYSLPFNGYSYLVCIGKGEMASLYNTYDEAYGAAWALYDRLGGSK